MVFRQGSGSRSSLPPVVRTGGIPLGDDTVLALGQDNDFVFYLSAASVLANTAITDVLIGTPVTPALAANSGIISNITASGDILIAVNNGGNSRAVFFADASADVTSLYAAGVEAIRIDANGNLGIGGTAVDGGASFRPRLHLIVGAGSGQATPDAVAQIVIDSDTNTGLNLLTPNDKTASISFGDPQDNNTGKIVYTHSASSMEFVSSSQGMLLTAGTLSFSGAHILSNTSGDFTINPTASLNVTLTAADADAFTANDGTTDYYNIDTTIAASTTVAHRFDMTNHSFASGAGSHIHLMGLRAFTWTVTGGANVTTPVDGLSLRILAPVIGSTSATTFTQISTLYVAATDVSDAEITATLNLAAEFDGAVRITTGDLSFGSAASITNTTGDLTINPTASLNITLTANDADAFTANDGSTDYYNIDTRIDTSGVHAHSFDTSNPSFANIPTASFTLVNLIGYTFTITTDADDITGDFATILHVQRTTIASDTASTNFTGIVSSLRIRGVAAGSNVILDNMASIHIEDGGGGGGTETVQHGIFFNTLTVGTTDYYLTMGNTDVDHNLLHVGVDGDPIFAWSEAGDIFTLTHGLTVSAGTLTAGTVDINGGAIDGAAIGAASATTIVGTTIDATTDFTIGATVITDGVLTDAGGFDMAADLTLSVGDYTSTASQDSAAVADEVSFGRYEIGAGNTVMALSQETAVVTEIDETKFSHKFQVRVNGATFFIMMTDS